MTGKVPKASLQRAFPFIALALVGITSAYFLLVTRVALAIVFAGYTIILIQSRVPLWRIIRGFKGAPTLRRLVRAALFFVPLPFLGIPMLKVLAWGIPAGIGCGLFLLLCQFPSLRVALSKDFVAILPPLSREERFREFLYPILSGIAQEYFYKGVMLYILQNYLGFWSVVLAALFFAFEHILHEGAAQNFDRYDILLQTLLALGLGTIFFFSQSLIGCMLGHIVYNSPAVIEAARRKSEQ